MIIGLTGYAGCGKSTIAEALAFKGYGRRKFAAPLKDMLRAFLRSQGADQCTIEKMIEGDLKLEPSPLLNGATPRHAMQTLGTDWGRALISEDLWCDAAVRGATADQNLVYDDVRFDNEAKAIRSLGGVIIRINRVGVGRVGTHVSEELVEPDIKVNNNGLVEEAVASVLAAVMR